MAQTVQEWSSSIAALGQARGQMTGTMLPFSGITPSMAPHGNAASRLPLSHYDPLNMGTPFGGTVPFASTLQQSNMILPQSVGETSRHANPEHAIPLLTMPVEHEGVHARFEVPSKNELGMLVSRFMLDYGRSVPAWNHSSKTSRNAKNGLNAGRAYDKNPMRAASLSHCNVLGLSQLNAILLNDEWERYSAFLTDAKDSGVAADTIREAVLIDPMFEQYTPANIINGMYTTLGPVVDTTLAGQDGLEDGLIRAQSFSLTGVSRCLDYTNGEGLCPDASYYLVARRFLVKGGEEPVFSWVKDPDRITNRPVTYKPSYASDIELYPLQLAIVAVPSGGRLPEEYRHYTTYGGAQHYDGVVKRLGRVFHTYDERANFSRPYTAPRPPAELRPVYDVHTAATRRPAFDLLLELSV